MLYTEVAFYTDDFMHPGHLYSVNRIEFFRPGFELVSMYCTAMTVTAGNTVLECFYVHPRDLISCENHLRVCGVISDKV